MSISFSLFQLQKIDSQIQESEKRISQIIMEIENNPEITSAMKDLVESQKKSDNFNKEISSLNQTISQKKIKIEQSEASLYGGKEKNPKLLQDLQVEIELIKRHISDLENELLEKIYEEEFAKRDLEDKKDKFRALDTKSNSIKSLLMSEKINLEQKVKRLYIERNTARSQIKPEYLLEYERLASTKQGIAIGTILDNSCSICGATFTPAQCQSARSQNEIFHCPTCHRIIYGN